MQQSIIPLLPMPFVIIYFIKILILCGEALIADTLNVSLQSSNDQILKMPGKRFMTFLRKNGSNSPN